MTEYFIEIPQFEYSKHSKHPPGTYELQMFDATQKLFDLLVELLRACSPTICFDVIVTIGGLLLTEIRCEFKCSHANEVRCFRSARTKLPMAFVLSTSANRCPFQFTSSICFSWLMLQLGSFANWAWLQQHASHLARKSIDPISL